MSVESKQKRCVRTLIVSGILGIQAFANRKNDNVVEDYPDCFMYHDDDRNALVNSCDNSNGGGLKYTTTTDEYFYYDTRGALERGKLTIAGLVCDLKCNTAVKGSDGKLRVDCSGRECSQPEDLALMKKAAAEAKCETLYSSVRSDLYVHH